MFRIATTSRRAHAVRRFSDIVQDANLHITKSEGGSGGSSFFQRLTAFTIGAGIVSPLMYYFIYEELKGMLIIIIYFFRITFTSNFLKYLCYLESNQLLVTHIQTLEKRIQDLETKK